MALELRCASNVNQMLDCEPIDQLGRRGTCSRTSGVAMNGSTLVGAIVICQRERMVALVIGGRVR
jgi:hypothetical protein